MTRAFSKATESVSDAKFVIQNMPGAGGLTGLNYVMQQPSDGYTLYEALTDQIIQMITKETDYTLEEIKPVAQTQEIINMLFIKKGETRFTNFEELIKYARESDENVTLGVPSLNSFDNAMIAFIEEKYGLTFKYVPFNKPAERYSALSGGFIDVLFEQVGDVKQFIDSGEFNPIIVYNDKRLEQYPNTPTTVENDINVTTGYSRGIWAKAGTSQEVIDYLNTVFKKAVETEEWKKFQETQLANLRESYKDSKEYKLSLEEMYQQFESVLQP